MSGSTVNPLFDAMHAATDAAQNFSVGENGMLQYNETGLTSSKSPIAKAEAALVALSVALVRADSGKSRKGGKSITKKTGSDIGVQRHAILRVFNMALDACKAIPDEVARADYVRRLVVLTFQKRDIRGNFGGGERTLSYWLFIELNNHFPETMRVLVHELPNYGSWLDLNKLYEILHRDGLESRQRDLLIDLSNSYLLKSEIIKAYAVQLQLDANTLRIPKGERGEDSTISLAAKWIPKENRATDRFTKFAKSLAKVMFPTEFNSDFKHAMNLVRRMVVNINREIKTTEQLMCAKRFADIEFRVVPGRCLNKFSKAWLDEDRKKTRQHPGDRDRAACRKHYQEFLQLVANGKVSAKGKSMFVHEIANEVGSGAWPLAEDRRVLLEAQFNDHVKAIEKYRLDNGKTDMGDTIPIADVSGSMSGDPMGCAISVAVIASHFNSPAWRDYMMTFTSTPTLIRLRYPRTQREYDSTKGYGGYSYWDRDSTSGNSIYSDLGAFNPRVANRELTWVEKLRVCSRADWGGSTNFLKAFDCLFAMAMSAKVQLPARIMCVTDMQWDEANSSSATWGADSIVAKMMGQQHQRWSSSDFGNWNTGMESIENMLRRTQVPGTHEFYKIPEFIFWNARGGHGGYAAQADKRGAVMVSGWSTSMLKVFLNDGELVMSPTGASPTSWDVLEKTLSDEAYTQIRMLCVSVGEGLFAPLQKVYSGNAIKMPRTIAQKAVLYHSDHRLTMHPQPRAVSGGWEAGSASILAVQQQHHNPPASDSDTDSCSSMPPLVEGAADPTEARMDAMEEKVDGLAQSLSGIQGMLAQLLARK